MKKKKYCRKLQCNLLFIVFIDTSLHLQSTCLLPRIQTSDWMASAFNIQSAEEKKKIIIMFEPGSRLTCLDLSDMPEEDVAPGNLWTLKLMTAWCLQLIEWNWCTSACTTWLRSRLHSDIALHVAPHVLRQLLQEKHNRDRVWQSYYIFKVCYYSTSF